MEGIYMNKKEQFLGQKHGVEIKVYALFSPGHPYTPSFRALARNLKPKSTGPIAGDPSLRSG